MMTAELFRWADEDRWESPTVYLIDVDNSAFDEAAHQDWFNKHLSCKKLRIVLGQVKRCLEHFLGNIEDSEQVLSELEEQPNIAPETRLSWYRLCHLFYRVLDQHVDFFASFIEWAGKIEMKSKKPTNEIEMNIKKVIEEIQGMNKRIKDFKQEAEKKYFFSTSFPSSSSKMTLTT